ncbi:MAG TPA: ferrochelatase [Acidimicrobiales bacterium]|nr:ferrochelatase [Acidimicrobiales bacterium]
MTGGYDAILLLSFGGPEGPDDVVPFLENVTRGRGVPRERLEEVAQQYLRFGGRSPINDQNRALLGALRAELDRRGHDLPLHWGNRNWAPYVEDVVDELTDAGHRRVLAVSTSAYSSYSACRQYLEDIERAQGAVRDTGREPPAIDKVRPYWNHPGFVLAVVERVHAALESLAPADRNRARLVFTAHSVPLSMAETSDYQAQLVDEATLVAERVAVPTVRDGADWDLVYQSRSGPPQVPWLEPDIVDHLRSLHQRGDDVVVVVPIGFTSDHMEVVYDLDTQAAEAARSMGMTMVRAGTVGTHPLFVRGLVDVLDEHLVGATPAALGSLGPRVNPCRPGCCPAPARPGRPG